MNDNQSGGKRSEMNAVVIERDLAAEMRRIVLAAASVAVGEPAGTPKAQINRAWDSLGRPDYWRVREAFYGNAGNWKGTAIEEFRRRDAARRERLERKVEAGRAKARQLGHIFASAAERLRDIDPDFYREQIAGHELAARELGALDRPVAEAGDAK